jgi:hypothetical protein
MYASFWQASSLRPISDRLFAYRLDEASGAFFFIPTRTRDAQGRSIAMTPLLDRPVTIPAGIRRINESAALMAADLSPQLVCR